VKQAASDSLQEWGFGAASVRFICGTQGIHKTLERRVSHFLGMEDTILYAACFDANTGLFETILGPEDAVISDELNHASIIDGVRLCKAKRYRYKNNDMRDLAAKLQQARDEGARRVLITTDGVFSMDGTVAQLDAICDLADKYGAMVHHDDCHATGFMGAQGRGVHEYCGVMDRVDIITGTFGKALGGGSGGFTSGRQEVIDILRQRSRPYLFSNTLAPAICAASLKVLDMLEASTVLRDRLHDNTRYFREQMQVNGFAVPEGDHPIVPVMLGDAVVAQQMSERLLELGIYAIGFFYPVVPQGKARIRVQISAGHTRADLDKAVSAFSHAYKEMSL
jgi:glycine C-acetyltransferase